MVGRRLRNRASRVAISGLLWAGLASSAVAGAWQAGLRPMPQLHDEAADLIQAANCIDRALPQAEAVGVVGYFNQADGGYSTGGFDTGRQYFAMQYALAPVLVQLGAVNAWVIGALPADTDVGRTASHLGFRPVVRCGQGLVLFRNLNPHP